MQARARSLRTALFATALISAVAAPAAAQTGTPTNETVERTAQQQSTESRLDTTKQAESRRLDLERQLNQDGKVRAPRQAQRTTVHPYRLRAGTLFGLNEARGQLLWSRNRVVNRGFVRGQGRGYTVLTFRHFGPRRDVTRRFVVRQGTRLTNYRLSGDFNMIRVRQCRVLSPTNRVCTVRILRRGLR